MGNIVVEKVSKAYRNRRRRARTGDNPDLSYGDRILVLDHIDLEFQDGEMVCILGPPGCGKSTLLTIIDGSDHPSAGHMR